MILPNLPPEVEARILFFRAFQSTFCSFLRNELCYLHKIGRTPAQATTTAIECLADYLESAGVCADFTHRPWYSPDLQPYRRRDYGWHMGKLKVDFCYAERSPWLEPLHLAAGHGQILKAAHDVVVFYHHWGETPHWCVSFTASGSQRHLERWPGWEFECDYLP